MSVTDFVADGSTSYDISGLASSIESSLALPSSSDGNSFDLSSKNLYLRLNLVNKTTNKVVEAANYTVKRDGKEINTPTMTNWPNVDCKTNKGTFFYLTNNTSYITKDNIKYTFSVPDGQKISDYKIDVYLSDEAADVINYNYNNLLFQEPTLKAKIIYNLMPQSEKDKLTFDATDDSSLDASKVFDFRQAFTSKTAKVQLLTEENKQRLCEALGVTDLSKVTDLYVRWMITDKSCNAIPGITTSGLTLRKDKTTEKEIYYTWFSENAASTLSAALNPTFTFPTTMSWGDLKVSCVVSNTKLVEGTNVKYGVMIKEPDAFNIKFNVSLEEAPLLNDLDAAYKANLKTKLLYLKETTIKNKQLVITDIASQIKDFSLYTKDASGNYEASAAKPIYYRVSIIDKKTNKPMSSISYNEVSEAGGISGGLNSSSFQGKDKYNNSKGLFYYSKDKTSVPESDLYIAFGFNNETDFKNSRIEVYFSDEAPVLENYLVVTEPTIKGKLVYDIKSATDAPFKHYKGYANADNDYEVIDKSKNQLRQKVSTWEYTYVVDETDHKTVSLMLPIQNFESSGDQLEPLGYFRWYNYDTDNASANLSVEGSSSLLNSVKDADNVDKGLMAFNLMQHAIQSTVGVKYTRPSDPNWKGETIACDVSRYIDGIDATGTYMEHEPTLSIRYIFHIIPSTQMANILQEDLINDSKDLTFEDNKNVTVGFKDDNSKMTLRLDFVDPKMYYFYPVTNPKKHVYYLAGSTEAETNAIVAQRKIKPEDFSSDIKKAATIEWRAYNGTRDKMCILGAGNVSDFPRFFDLSISLLNGATWTDLDGGTATKPTFNPGDHFYVVAYVKDETGEFSSPMANFSIRYFRFYPKTFEEMGTEDVTRQISYLDENYNNIAVVSFDNDSPEQTLSAPTSPDDNQSKNPSAWNRRSYGFVYKDLIDKSANKNGDSNVYYNTKHSPQHGEYGIYKTANIKNISGAGNNGTDGYMWYSDKELHDRTYEATGKSQSGSFLYVDASDESRTIASAEFTASLCTGQQMAFSACIADMTMQTVKPQIMFRLFGLEKDEYGNIKDKKLLHSFSSGEFGTNRLSSEEAKWYQVYGKITIQQEAQVEKYSDFRIEIDNYSKGTVGADYAVDDIRIYLKPAKVEIYQDRPACGETSTGSIKLKIRAIHETLNAILNHKDTKIHYRLVNEDGSPVTGEGLYNYKLDGVEQTMPDSYASVDVYDSEAACKSHTIDGVNMIEKDADGETYIILANHPFKLTKGKKYYVSVCADSNPDAPDANWGKPSDVCSIYSAIFEMIGQTPAITDVDGKIITEYRVNCTDTDPKVTLKGSLTTIDPNTGEKITLTGVPFLWYIDDSSTPVDATPSTTIEIPVSKIGYGAHKIYMKPETGTKNTAGDMVFTVNGVEYLMCTEKIPVPLRIAKDGPQLNFGFNDVDYPFNDGSYEASLRIGLPQLKKLKDTKGFLQIPLHSVSYQSSVADKTLTFIGNDNNATDKVYVATTNDPLWNAEGAKLLSTPVATLSSSTLTEVKSDKQYTLDLKFSDDVLKNFHEGYYYELRFAFEQKAAATGSASNCPGESYLKVKIVPEFITWTPTADGGMNANWNNDANWHRSSSAELYDDDYTDYQTYGSSTSAAASSSKIEIPTLNSYVPMKFTKVTIDNLKGLPFPDLGNIVYRTTNQIANKLTNGKGNEATKYIQYDIMAFWNEADTEKGLDTEGNLKCEKFYGNTCHQIYFKPQGELRDQCYLIYDKAWVEKELEPNKWYTMASPLQYIYAGDMYVPAKDGRQETKAFTDINFDDKTADGTSDVYSRSKYPVYQRAWMKSGAKEITAKGNYPASHYPEGAKTDDMNLNLGYWSHVYNKVDESYAADGTFGGFAIKAGNALLPKDQTKNALLRLPKEDKEYQYFDYTGSTPSSSKVAKNDGHGKLLVAFNNDEKHLAEMTQNLGTDNNSGFYLVANPYTCSISLKKFFEVNTGLQKAVWVVDGGDVSSVSATNLADKDFFVQPTQSFFVKKDGTASVDAVKFTSAMYVDRLLSTGFVIASDYLKDVNVSAQNAKGQTSKARIAVREEASDDYDEQEDVDLLCDQNLSGIPQVYTVAGSQAVAVNATPKIEWMPMGVIMENGEKNEMVNLDFKGVAKLDAPLYLYDAANGQYTELQDGNEVSIQANEHGRYFLTQTRGTTGIQQIEAEAESNQLKVYSPAAGMIVVSALNGEKLGRVEVFTLDGKRVHSYQLPDKQRMILRVPSGVYIVKASTQSCAQAKGQKVAVR
ncbi:T9SS type A sorting domain-containing protein [Prevotella copri]|uniref:T9SS type A sorting domain-containing protein n=1 Tax=Segatella copri TaxID=165179 RepID=UPI001C3874E1|nr:T9SS type A sorting domain-containing protein [Segatella copri]MBV3402061.1 T9SS type A sorting domain-containing protein [Segatella copri]